METWETTRRRGGGWVVPLVLVLILVVLAVLLVVWFVRTQNATRPPRHRSDGGGSPREALDMRLVSGDISEEEYRRVRAALSDTPPPGNTQTPATPV